MFSGPASTRPLSLPARRPPHRQSSRGSTRHAVDFPTANSPATTPRRRAPDASGLVAGPPVTSSLTCLLGAGICDVFVGRPLRTHALVNQCSCTPRLHRHVRNPDGGFDPLADLAVNSVGTAAALVSRRLSNRTRHPPVREPLRVNIGMFNTNVSVPIRGGYIRLSMWPVIGGSAWVVHLFINLNHSKVNIKVDRSIKNV